MPSPPRRFALVLVGFAAAFGAAACVSEPAAPSVNVRVLSGFFNECLMTNHVSLAVLPDTQNLPTQWVWGEMNAPYGGEGEGTYRQWIPNGENCGEEGEGGTWSGPQPTPAGTFICFPTRRITADSVTYVPCSTPMSAGQRMLVRGAIERRAKNLDSIADPTLREFCARLIALADYYIDGIGLHVGYVAFQPSDPIHEALSHKNRDYFTLSFPGIVHIEQRVLDQAGTSDGEWHLASVMLHEMIHNLSNPGYSDHGTRASGEPHPLGGTGPYQNFEVYNTHPFTLLGPVDPSCMRAP